ncbi:MAG: cytochrome B561, N terminal-domain-containing protein [Linnemannia gamsii]|nr:MAG: cytochrome B561, N terminal-domain-containing protein [Linnemannia gamsii]
MAELTKPRPSQSNPIDNDNNEDEKERLYRQPESVPPSDEFFNRPALAFNPASMDLKENELGLLVRATTPEADKDLARDLEEQEHEARERALANATRVAEDEDMEETIEEDTNQIHFAPSNRTSTQPISSSGANQADQDTNTPTAHTTSKKTLLDLMNPTPTTRTSSHSIFEQSVKPPTFDPTFNTYGNNAFSSSITGQGKKEIEAGDEEQEQEVASTQKKVTSPTTLFPESQPDRGLVLTTKEQQDDQHVPDEEEDVPVVYPSLSEVFPSRSTSEVPHLSFETSTAAAVPTLPESTNVRRWDLEEDEEQSDAEIDLEFVNPRAKESQESQDLRDSRSSLSPVAPPWNIAESRVSPFAAFLETHHIGDKLTRSDRKEKQGTASQSDDGSDHDVKDYVGAAALAGGALLARKFLHNKDSGDEKESTGDVDLASLLREPLSKLLGSQPRPADSERTSVSDDGVIFEGGVGGAVKSLLDASLQRQDEVSDNDKVSEIFTPRFSTAEKGKQVVRDGQAAPTVVQRESMDDLPPINSLSDNALGSVGKAPVLQMMSPTPVSPPAATMGGPRSGIYPAAPPEPWAPSSLSNTLSQRRSPIANVKTDAANAKDAFNHDPNLAFASLPRKKSSAAQPKPAEGVRSLLFDYPDEVAKPTAAAVPTVTLPADPSQAPVLRGRYELPSINKIDQWKSKNTLAPNAFRRLVINIVALFVSSRVMKGRVYKVLIKMLSSFISPSIIYWTEWAVIIVLLFNIAEVLYSYTRRANHFENLPLTPSQRALLGLEPVASKVPGAVPVFKKSTIAPQNLTERPIMSTYMSPLQGSLASSRTAFQKPAVSSVASEYRDAATILNKSMSRAFNTVSVQDKAGVERLMRNVEAREELKSEWKGVDSDPSKRAFGLHSAYGTPQAGLQGGIDMAHSGAHMTDHSARPDLLASLNSRGPVSRYQPALRTTLSKDHKSKTDLQKDGLHVYGHIKVLKSLKLSEEQLDRWVFNLRNWLWSKIVMHICNEMAEVDAEMAKQGLSYLDCRSATMFYTSGPLPQNATTSGNAASAAGAAAAAPAAPMVNSLGWGAASIANPRLPSAFAPAVSQPQQPLMPTSLQDLDARYGDVPFVRRRMILELYLAIPGFANRKFVVERLQAMGPLLRHFIWDSNGVTWDGGKKAWTPDLPTDTQLIMHLFTVYMDLSMPAQPSQSYDRFLFSYKHYVPMEAKPDATTSLQIKQTAKFPPNYNLVVDGGMWEVVPKRLNVWYTLVLFIYMVMKEHGGYIGQLNIGTRAMGLGDVVEGYDV